jgi:hypothetical protein
MTTAVCVLRSGGEYGPKHVDWLRKQIEQHLPSVRVVCFSDIEVPCERIELAHRYPGWWSKLEICRTDALSGDVLFFDLDTVIVGDLRPLARVGRTAALSDFNWPGMLQSSVMYLTEADRRKVWEVWSISAHAHIEADRGHGDQRFLHYALGFWAQWQSVLPKTFVSYKVDLKRRGLTDPPPGAAVVVFHGKPRPWHVEANWIPKLT